MNPKLKPEIKQKWLDALRSGEYEQGEGYLRYNDKYCCLGVLTDLYLKETNKEWAIYKIIDYGGGIPSSTVYGNVFSGYTNEGTLEENVAYWAFETSETRHMGYDYHNPAVSPDQISLSQMNDHYKKNFSEIADLIEAWL